MPLAGVAPPIAAIVTKAAVAGIADCLVLHDASDHLRSPVDPEGNLSQLIVGGVGCQVPLHPIQILLEYGVVLIAAGDQS